MGIYSHFILYMYSSNLLFSQEKVKLKVASSRFRLGIEGNYLQNTTDAYPSMYTKEENNSNSGYYGALNFEFFISKGSRNASFYTQLGYLKNQYVFYNGFGLSAEKFDIEINRAIRNLNLRYLDIAFDVVKDFLSLDQKEKYNNFSQFIKNKRESL